MAQSAMTVRLDSRMKTEFDTLCEQFGMSSNTAINIFVNAVVRSRSIPFSIEASAPLSRDNAKRAFDNMCSKANESSAPEMTLEEINEEIRASREERMRR